MTTAAGVITHYGPYAGGPGWWFIFPLLWFLLVAAVIFAVVRRGRARYWHYGPFAGEQKLAERYAAGEIDEEEYQRRLGVLRQSQR